MASPPTICERSVAGSHWKRKFDAVVSLILLVVLAPVLALVAGLVRLLLGAPILFVQQRTGSQGASFSIYKFRTMRNLVSPGDARVPDTARLTRLGRFLRLTSLDELPELFNVVIGDMSLVGPRPLLPHYLPYYSEPERVRHAVKPGITGMAQVSGRNLLSWDEKLALDVWYVENWSFTLDLRILLLTVWRVATRRGAVADTTTVESDLSLERAGRVEMDTARFGRESSP